MRHMLFSTVIAATLTLGFSSVANSADRPLVSELGPYKDGLIAFRLGDYKTALPLFRLAAAQGDAAAEAYLGVMTQRGEGVRRNHKEAMRLLGDAANKGSPEATTFLGAICDQLYRGYLNSDGVPKDYVRAYMWITLAVASGYGKGERFLDPTESEHFIAAKMTPQQISEAQNLATKCKKSNFKQCD